MYKERVISNRILFYYFCLLENTLESDKIKKVSRFFEFFVFFSISEEVSHMILPDSGSLYNSLFFEYFFRFLSDLLSLGPNTDYNLSLVTKTTLLSDLTST